MKLIYWSKVYLETQWWNFIKHIHSGTILKYNFEVSVLYLSISIVCYIILPLHYILEEDN